MAAPRRRRGWAGRQGALRRSAPLRVSSASAAMAAFPRHRRFLGGFVCGAAAGAASCWAAWRLLRSQSQPEPVPGRALPEGKRRGAEGRPGAADRWLCRAGAAAPRRGGNGGASGRPRSPQTTPPPSPNPLRRAALSLLPPCQGAQRGPGSSPEFLRRAEAGRRLSGDAGAVTCFIKNASSPCCTCTHQNGGDRRGKGFPVPQHGVVGNVYFRTGS